MMLLQPAERGRLIPSFRGRNWGSGNFSHLFKVIQLMRGGDDNQVQFLLLISRMSSTLLPPNPEKLRDSVLSSDLQHMPATCWAFIKSQPLPHASRMVLSSLWLPSEVCILLNLIWQLKRLGLREVKILIAGRSAGLQGLIHQAVSCPQWQPGWGEAHAEISWAKKWMGWSKRARGKASPHGFRRT